MIRTSITTSPRLKKMLNGTYMKQVTPNFTEKVAKDIYFNVIEYGVGKGHQTGGSPWWQGRVTVEGHYRGYLSGSHKVNHVEDNHSQITSSAEFVYGVIEGYSTNWAGVRFQPNPYHKRAVDKFFKENGVHRRLREAMSEA